MSPFLEEDDFENKILEEEEDNDHQILLKNNTGQLDIVGLLRQVAETHDLQSVQSIKLKIMTKDLPLHSLYSYLPGLKELDLECSNINSLRELGADLRSLQVLRLGRCRLESLDGILAFKNLKEFSAPNNYITNLGLAGQLSHIIYFDVSRNFIDHWNQLSFFKDASTLEELHFQGNGGCKMENYRTEVEKLLPQLVILDGIHIDGRNLRRNSPVLRAPEAPVRPRSGRKLQMNQDLCGNITTALTQNKKRQKNMGVGVGSKAPLKCGKLTESETLLSAAVAWKQAFDKLLKSKDKKENTQN
ncbi:hypothetical protein GE061_001209 [Apolygus lucorum]|uniref:Uncharacterized protein n=1 Tax=Apolygus lucorum TaxID=248454 RepID=A0A6A4KM74_APOLU|nr:hypothetical protein GE061_001209 [Apolygus lucorum]